MTYKLIFGAVAIVFIFVFVEVVLTFSYVVKIILFELFDVVKKFWKNREVEQ
jgi:hypothetical protein